MLYTGAGLLEIAAVTTISLPNQRAIAHAADSVPKSQVLRGQRKNKHLTSLVSGCSRLVDVVG